MKATASLLSRIVLPPVIEQELRVALHRRDARKARLTQARFAVIGVALFLLLGPLMGPGSRGSILHFYLFLAGLALATGPALRLGVGVFTSERRRQSLELLYLTGMHPSELFMGKLLAGALVSSNELMVLAPLMSVPFLAGGVSLDVFVVTIVCLPAVFVFVLSLGLLASALCRDEGSALVTVSVLLGIFGLALPLPYNLGLWMTGSPPFSRSWLALSPALGPWMGARNLGGFSMANFWVWAAATWTWSAICLFSAAATLKRSWSRDIEGAGAQRKAKWQILVYGSAVWRQRLRRRLLSANAYQWLAQRDRRPALQAWGFLGAVCVFWTLGCCAWPRVWPSPMNLYATATLLLLGLEFLAAHASARQMAADRRDGMLEEILTTSLSPRDMLDGQKAALREQFKPVKWALTGLLLLMVWGGLLNRRFGTQAAVSYLAVWCVYFAWCWRPVQRSAQMGMWVAANCGRALPWLSAKGGKRSFRVFYFIFLFNSVAGLRVLTRSFPSGGTTEMVVVAIIAFSVVILILARGTGHNSLAESFVSQLRAIAQEPVPALNDPRFKKWKDVRNRFPSELGDNTADGRPVRAAGAWLWKPVGRMCGRVHSSALRETAENAHRAFKLLICSGIIGKGSRISKAIMLANGDAGRKACARPFERSSD